MCRVFIKSLMVGFGASMLFFLVVISGMILFPQESLWIYVALERSYLALNLAVIVGVIMTVGTFAVLVGELVLRKVRKRVGLNVPSASKC